MRTVLVVLLCVLAFPTVLKGAACAVGASSLDAWWACAKTSYKTLSCKEPRK